ncbi:MAG: hypothetical protein FD137_1460 [Spirochaetes bacterium]|nr:MAG: hypothetical protein FD137_1460 [Spirochaetota bacterium]
MAWKKLHQWKASMSPRRARRSAVLPLALGMPGGAAPEAPRLRIRRTSPRLPVDHPIFSPAERPLPLERLVRYTMMKTTARRSTDRALASPSLPSATEP